jgi:hypothetical protein
MSSTLNSTTNSDINRLNSHSQREEINSVLCFSRMVTKKLDNQTEAKIEEIVSFSQQVNETNLELIKIIDKKLLELIDNVPLGGMTKELLKKIDESYFDKMYPLIYSDSNKLWKNYKLINNYIRSCEPLKSELFKEIEGIIRDFSSDPNTLLLSSGDLLDKGLIKSVYVSDDNHLIQLFQMYLPVPPLFIFDSANQPEILVQRESEKAHALTAFQQRNAQDPLLEKKVLYLQRAIRSVIRRASEIGRIGKRYFPISSSADAHALRMIEDANTPYYPKQCDPKLAVRIKNAASQVKLFSSVYHLLDPNNIASIIDDCLYGRHNLICFYKTFRPAALSFKDIANGDGNVICLGPDKIDEKCFKGRTVGLELDLELLTNEGKYLKNGTLFFKQCDLGYDIGMIQSIAMGNAQLRFTHTKQSRNPPPNCTSLQLYDDWDAPTHFSEVPKDFLISNNMQNMHQILSLNFFRFLDGLICIDCTSADSKIQEIYAEIAKLDDEQLQKFILDLGKKMSCSSEFNIYGAYKIDLNALRSITIYQGKKPVKRISMDALFEELNKGNYTLLNQLKLDIPEIFSSKRFADFITEHKIL